MHDSSAEMSHSEQLLRYSQILSVKMEQLNIENFMDEMIVR